MAEFKENMEKKGKKLVVSNTRRSEVQEICVEDTLDFHKIWVGLTKIAYLAAFEFLGDDFLDDPLNVEWQKGVRATSLEEFEQMRIRNDFSAKSQRALLPPLAEHEHAVSVCNFLEQGPVVAVRLFNSDLLTRVFIASGTSNFGLAQYEGKVVVCDSLSKQVRVEPFKEHYERILSGGVLHPPNQGSAS